MKIKTKTMTAAEVLALKRPRHQRPRRPMWLLGALVRLLAIPDLWATRFTCRKEYARAGRGPYLILMNHSSFIDLKIAYRLFFPHRFSIVCTTDAFVGKAWLMRLLGCIPTQKFVTDVNLVLDMVHTVKKNRTSVLMFPEAGYSFDGRATTLPDSLGTLCKKLDVPVLMVKTSGAFLRDPLYGGLRLRRCRTSATVTCLFTREELAEASDETVQAAISEAFTFDAFREQQESGTTVSEPFRAEGLHRILYRCPDCRTEGQMHSEGIHLTCRACGKVYTLTEHGALTAQEGECEFSHVPDWYEWERQAVREELEAGRYRLETRVTIGVLCDTTALYLVGEGTLIHDRDGFHLRDDSGAIDYRQATLSSYSLNADYFWYEIGDVIGIGNRKRLYYCFPTEPQVNVTKARLAAEEAYKILTR